MIADIIAPNIDDIRATNENQFFYEFDMPPTDDEIDEFIISGSCFNDEMKKFLFQDWVYKNFPDRADKVWHLIEKSHDGQVNDTRWGVRMRGEGPIAQLVAQQYRKYGKLYGMNAEDWSLDRSLFRRPSDVQGKLF